MLKRFMMIAAALLISTGFAMAAVDLNTATEQQLESINGLGPVKAKKIIAYREKNGPYKSVQDLKKVGGFGDKSIAKLQPELTVGGSTTPAASTAAPDANSKMKPSTAKPAADATSTGKTSTPADKIQK